MSSEFLASGENVLDSNLGGAWDITNGYAGRKQDLGIARRFGGASVAYSLRDIGAMNGRVVKVRRDSGETTDPEEDFSANQVSSGALEDWVNGKLESTLPADVDTAAAAYSLRKVKASYSGDAVRIRRTSDSVEVNVAFDSDDKVSSSSAITNTTEQGGESGSTTATTLGDFLTEDINIFTDSSSQSWANIRSTDSFETSTALGGEVNYRKFTPNSGVGTSALFGITSFFDVSTSITYTISGQVYVPSGQTTVNAFKIVNGTSGSSPSLSGATNTVPATDQWVDFSFTSAIPTATQFYINAAKDQNAFFSPNGSDFIAFKDITVTATDSGATVHTWYDQAGVNNAVQETAANQPKIAENGALLADGLLFDGSNDSFEATDITDVNFPATVVSVSETNKIGSPNTALYSLNNDSNACCGFYRSTSKYAINNGTTTLEGSATYTTGVHRLKFDLFNGASSAGFSNAVSDISGDIGTQVSQVTHFRIAGSLKAGITNPHNGTIKEIILYTSDQSDNRFKIESNINNYYGLYNDEYEWDDATNTEWQNNVTNGTTTFTANGKDGFTITATGDNITSFKYRFTSPSTASNDYYKVSFNVDDPDGLFDDAQLRLTATGSGATAQTITNGFNSLSLRTGASFEYMSINSDGGGSSKTATLSDFKISRIARDGFVETWYDQSGNGFDLKSQSADTQPFIVNNGGFTGGVYSPSRLNNSTKQYLEISDPDFDSTNITSSKFGWLAVMANMEENDGSQAGGVILGNTRNTQSFPAGAIGLTLSDTNPNGRMFVTNLKTSSTGDFIGAVDNDDLFTSETIGTAVVDGSSLSTFLNGTTGSGTFTDLTLTSDVHFKIFQASDAANNVYYQNAAQGFIKELMFMQGDMIDDIVTIRNEVNNHYNIF